MDEELKTSSHHTLVESTTPRTKSVQQGSKPASKAASKAGSLANVNNGNDNNNPEKQLESSPLAKESETAPPDSDPLVEASDSNEIEGVTASQRASKTGSVYTSAKDLKGDAKSVYSSAVELQAEEPDAGTQYDEDFTKQEESITQAEVAETEPTGHAEPAPTDESVIKGSNANLLSGAASKPGSKPASRMASKPVSQAASRANITSGKSERSPLSEEAAAAAAAVTVSKPASKVVSKVPSQVASRTNLTSGGKSSNALNPSPLAETVISASKPSSRPISREQSKPVSREASKPASTQVSKPPSREASKPASKNASKIASKVASRASMGVEETNTEVPQTDEPLAATQSGTRPTSKPLSKTASKAVSHTASRAELEAAGPSKLSSQQASRPISRPASKPASIAGSNANITAPAPAKESSRTPLLQASYNASEAELTIKAPGVGAELTIDFDGKSNTHSHQASTSAAVNEMGSKFNMAQHALANDPRQYSKSVIAQQQQASTAALSQVASKPMSAATSFNQIASNPISGFGSPTLQPAALAKAASTSVSLRQIAAPTPMSGGYATPGGGGGAAAAAAGISKSASAAAFSQAVSPAQQFSPALSNSRSRMEVAAAATTTTSAVLSKASSAGIQAAVAAVEAAEQAAFDEFFGGNEDAEAAVAPIESNEGQAHEETEYHADYEEEEEETMAEVHAQAVEAVAADEAAGDDEDFEYDERYEEAQQTLEPAEEEQAQSILPNEGLRSSSTTVSKPPSGKLKEEMMQDLTNNIDYVTLISSLRREIALLKKEIGIRDDKIDGLKDKEHDLMDILELSKTKGTGDVFKNTRICLDRQKKAYQILVAKLRREIRRLKFQRNSTSDPLVEARYFPYLPRTPFSTASRQPQPGIIGNLPQRSSDYFALNPPPPTGNHLDSGNRWWWGSGPNITHPREASAKSTCSREKKKPTTANKAKQPPTDSTKKDDHHTMPPIVPNPNQEEPKVGDRVCVMIDGGRVLGSVKYVGIFDPYPGSGLWCGIKLHLPLGKHDGIVRGKRYFTCEENHGVFVKSDKIITVGHLSPKATGKRLIPLLAK